MEYMSANLLFLSTLLGSNGATYLCLPELPYDTLKVDHSVSICPGLSVVNKNVLCHDCKYSSEIIWDETGISPGDESFSHWPHDT